jgi:hypothetical protein
MRPFQSNSYRFLQLLSASITFKIDQQNRESFVMHQIHLNIHF